MRFSIVGPVHPYRGGISHYTTLLSRAFEETGHLVQVISFERQYPRWLYPGQSDRDTSQESLSIEAEFLLDPLYPWTWFTTANVIQRFAPEIVIIPWWTTFWAPAFWVLSRSLKRKNIPVLSLIHNVLPHERFPWDEWLVKRVLGQADIHIIQSEKERSRLRKLLPEAKPILVTHPIYDMFTSNRISKIEAKNKLGISNDRIVCLCFGLVRPYKGLRYAIEAISNLRQAGDPVHLVIAGEFWEDKSKYLAQIKQLNLSPWVTIADRYIPNEQVGLFFSAADIYLAPYIGGTQSGSLKIAVSFNLPIVLTANIADESIENSSSVQVVPPADATALSKAIKRMITSREHTTGSTRDCEASTWEEIVQAITKATLALPRVH